MVNGKKEIALSGLRGVCPHCGKTVVAKCGLVRRHHWAHVASQHCDEWFTGETNWHLKWKGLFDASQCEVRVTKGDRFHIADVLTKDKVVIEFQNSSISVTDVVKRESFYKRMIWVINGVNHGKNILTSKFAGVASKTPPSNFFRGEDYEGRACWVFDLKQARVDRATHKKMLHYGMNYDVYLNRAFVYADVNVNWSSSFVTLLHRINFENDILDLRDNKTYFQWKSASISWKEARMPVFIDMGNDSLLWIRSWIESDTGIAQEVTIEEFLSKYR